MEAISRARKHNTAGGKYKMRECKREKGGKKSQKR